jgi:hypothetical protein
MKTLRVVSSVGRAFVVIIDDGCDHFCSIGFPQSGDVCFEIIQDKPQVAEHASASFGQVRPGIISQHSKESWQAAAWLCERKRPRLFTLHFTQHRTTDANNNPPLLTTGPRWNKPPPAGLNFYFLSTLFSLLVVVT